MAKTAVVVANHDIFARGVGSNGHVGDLPRLDIGVDAQRLYEESMRAIFAAEPEHDRRTFFQGNLARRELVLLRLDFDHLRQLRGRHPPRRPPASAAASHCSPDQRQRERHSPATGLRVHSSTESPFPCLRIWSIPTVPEYSFIERSTSSTRSSPPPALPLTRRRPRFWKG